MNSMNVWTDTSLLIFFAVKPSEVSCVNFSLEGFCMLRRVFFLIFILILGAVGFRFFGDSRKDLPIIAITQIIEHTTLDTVREGLLQGLKEAGFEDGKNIRIVYQNAHGHMTTAAQIVQQFAQIKPKVLLALSTQSAQLLQAMAQQQKIPLVFSAVTDPVSAKLITDIKIPVQGLTGVSDYMDSLPQIHMMKAFVPHLKTLGVLHNPSEVNSTLFLQKDFRKAAEKLGLTLVFSPLNNTNEAVAATRALLGKVDAIYFPNDNTAMASVSGIVSVAHKHNTPVFANDEASVRQGAVAALSYDRIHMGKDTAKMVVRAMEEGALIMLPTLVGGEIQTIVNEASLGQLKMTIPDTLTNISIVNGAHP